MIHYTGGHGVRGKGLHGLTRTLLASIASLAILAAVPLGTSAAIAAGGNGSGGAGGGADANTGVGGTGGEGSFLSGGGGGGAGQTGGAGGGTRDFLNNPINNGGAGGLAPVGGTFVGGNGANTASGGGGGGAHGFVGTDFSTLAGAAQGGNGGSGSGGGAGGFGVVVTGTGNLGNSGQTASGGNGGNGGSSIASAGSGGSGGTGMVFDNGGATADINAIVSGGNGGNGGSLPFGQGPGGAGGAGLVSMNGGNITTSAAVSGGTGGNGAIGGAGIIFGGTGTLTTGASTTGGNGAAAIVVTGAANLIAGGTVTGGNGAVGVSFASSGTFTITGTVAGGASAAGAEVTTTTTTTISGALSGGAGNTGSGSGLGGGGGGAGGSGLVQSAGGIVNVNAATAGGQGGTGGGGALNGGGGGAGGAAIVLSNGGTVNADAALTGGQGGTGGGGTFDGGAGGAGGAAIFAAKGGIVNVNAALVGGLGSAGGGGAISGGGPGADGAGILGADIVVALTMPGSVAGGGSANAITFSGGSNSITGSGGTITGNVRVDTGASLDIDGGTLNLTSAISNVSLGGTLNLSGNVTTGDIAQITTTGSEIHYDDAAVVASAVVLNSNDTTLDVDTGDAAEQAGNISETGGARPLQKTGGGMLILSGTNTHTGATTVGGGTLELQNGAAIADTGAVVLDNVAGVNLVVTDSESIGSLSGGGASGGNVQVGAGQTLSTGGANTSTTFAGVISGSGGLTKLGTGTFTLTGSNSYGGATTVTSGVLDVTGSLTGTAQLVITGGTFRAHGSSLVDTAPVNVSGTGLFDTRGSETIGALSNNSVVSLGENNFTGDVLTAGVMSGTGTVNLDINLETGATDLLRVSSVAAGANTTYAFDNLGGAWLIPDILVVENGAATYDGTFSSSGLPPAGLVSFSLIDNGGDLYVHAEADLGVIGGITDAVTLTQSSVGAMLDHTSGRFGMALANEAEGSNCGVGAWQRGLGGAASASGETVTASGSSAGTATVDLSFGGGQFGLDVACANVGGSGVDVALGAFGGFAAGSTTQAIDGTVPSTTEASFQQGSGGVYAAIVAERFAAELQARYDATDFVFNNSNPSYGLVDAGLHTDRYSVSGAASYTLALGQVDLTPRAGFSISQTTASVLEFQNGETLAPDATLSIVGFVGGTLSATFQLEDQLTLTPFLSGTLYNEFADAPTSVFTDQLGNEINLVSANQGLVGEASLGIGVSQPFGDNGQFDASVNLDARFSDQFEGYGLGAKLRLQF